MTHMLKIEPFTAIIDVAPESAINPKFRQVQVVGIADRPEGPRWVAIETHDGWEYPRFVDAVKWQTGPEQEAWADKERGQ